MNPLTEPAAETIEETGNSIYQILPTAITVREDRHRQKFSRKPLDSLADSIRETGQIQPGVCQYNELGELELLVGERRLRACMFLQIPFRFYIKEEVNDLLLLEQIQLDENLQREDLDWRDEVKAKARLHTLLTEIHGEAISGMPGGQTLHMTAEHIGVKKSILQEDVTLAGFLEVPEVEAAPNKTTAKKIVKRMIQQVQRQESLAVALQHVADRSVEEQAPLTESARAEAKLAEAKQLNDWRKKAKAEGKEIKDREELVAFMDEHQAKTKSEAEIRLEKQLIYFNKRCILGKMEEAILAFEDESFDIVCFDPPWGVEFDAVRKESAGTKGYSDSAWEFFTKIEEWLRLIYQKMKPNSHLYMFFGMGAGQEEEFDDKPSMDEGFRYRDFIYDFLHTVGFNTNRMPLIWHKKGAHVTRNPTIWPGRSYEPIVYARKGNKPLVKLGASDVITTPMPTPAIKDIHPSAKHPEIYRELLLRSANPSDTILDPMAGSGMFGIAAESLQATLALNWFQIEIDSDFRNLQLINLTKGYEQICKRPMAEEGNQQQDDWNPASSPESFESIEPGSDEWTRYWKEHPEEQQAMLDWRVKMRGKTKL